MEKPVDVECQENGLVLNGGVADLKDPPDVKKRPSWSRGIDFFIACLGGSVGLGNVWRFPYLCYRNGGGAFLIPYFLCMIVMSLPLFILEVSIGQYMGAGGSKAWSILPLLQGLGLTITVIVFYVNVYYNAIMAWSFMYIFHSFAAVLPWDSCDGSWNTDRCSKDFNTTRRTILTTTTSANNSNSIYNSYNSSVSSSSSNLNESLVDPVSEFWEKKVLGLSSGLEDMGTPKWDLVLCLMLSWVLVYLCICKGIKSSGKVMYFTAPAPYVFMVIILIRNATLDGAGDGVRYYLTPNMTKLKEFSVWADAGKQTLFSSSVCQAIILTLGSYNKFKHNSCRDSILFGFVNAFTSLFAGFLVFTVLGFMSFQQGRPIDEVAESGPGLVFIAYPKAVAQMPLSQFWSVLFFIMIVLLGLDSEFLGVEAVITCAMDQFPNVLRRKYRKEMFVAVICVVNFILGLTFVCNGGMYALQLVDFYNGGRNLFLVGFLEVFAISYIYGFRRFYDNMVMMVGSTWMRRLKPYLTVCWLVLTPLLLLVLLVMTSLNQEELTYSRPNESVYHYPSWANAIGWMLTASSVVWVPVAIIYRFCKHGFSIKVLKLMCVPYKLKSHQMRPQDKLEISLYHLEQDKKAQS